MAVDYQAGSRRLQAALDVACATEGLTFTEALEIHTEALPALLREAVAMRRTEQAEHWQERTETITGWPKQTRCPRCGSRAAILGSTVLSATYECRGGTATDPTSAYGPDVCGQVWTTERRGAQD